MNGWQYICDSIKGSERKENKDRVFITENDKHFLAVLFDGISSADEANRGIDVSIKFIEENHQKLDEEFNYDISDLMFDVNQKITATDLVTPFSTYSAIHIPKSGETAFFSNLGESRIYEITPQYAKQLSHDDNPVYNKNVVTKYLGMVQLDRTQIENFSLNIREKKALLCSDGFYILFEDNLSKFHKILNFKRPQDIKNGLKREVSGKNYDDSSYILIFQ